MKTLRTIKEFGEEYHAMAQSIRNHETELRSLERIDQQLCRLWENGVFTLREFRLLDSMISFRQIMLESESAR